MNSAISSYHQSKIARDYSQSLEKLEQKKKELEFVLNTIHYEAPKEGEYAVGVLGCADPRHVKMYGDMFRDILKREVKVVIFDITIAHLPDIPEVVEHDVTYPLPRTPFNFIFSHILLKFVESARKMEVIKVAHSALKKDGVAIHMFGIGPRFRENDPTPEEVEAFCTKNVIPSHIIALPKEGYALVTKKLI